jgi:uncharacterized membrane protein
MGMTGTMNALFAAALVFLFSHLGLSSAPARRLLMSWFGEGGFRALYSTVALVALVWLGLAYRDAPGLELWPALGWTRLVPVFVMPIAAILFVCAVTTPNPTLVGSERWIDSSANPIRGIFRITRHPMLWSFAIWSAAHMLANGDAASLVFFGSFFLLSLIGMKHIDVRRAGQSGAVWGPIAMTSSIFPFAAILSRRTRFDWQGIGWLRLAGGIAFYFGLLFLHPVVFGVAAIAR